MTGVDERELAQIPVSLVNASDWDGYAQQLSAEGGIATVLTPDLLTHMVGSAVPLLFATDAAGGSMDALRGTFADPVIAQCQRYAGHLPDGRPASAAVELVGTRTLDGHPALRVHVSITLEGNSQGEPVTRQFWDLQLGAQVITGEASCPNCGAPIPPGELVCEHCQTDVRQVVQVPLVVSRLELY